METTGIFWGFILAFALYDGTRDWASGDGLGHTFRAFIRAAFIILLSFYDFGFDGYYGPGAFKLACYRYVIFWISFDLLVNTIHFRTDIFRYRELKHIFHLGNTAFLDWVFRAAWGVANIQDIKKPNFRTNEIGAKITQYVFKLCLLILTYQWYVWTSDTYFF